MYSNLRDGKIRNESMIVLNFDLHIDFLIQLQQRSLDTSLVEN